MSNGSTSAVAFIQTPELVSATLDFASQASTVAFSLVHRSVAAEATRHLFIEPQLHSLESVKAFSDALDTQPERPDIVRSLTVRRVKLGDLIPRSSLPISSDKNPMPAMFGHRRFPNCKSISWLPRNDNPQPEEFEGTEDFDEWKENIKPPNTVGDLLAFCAFIAPSTESLTVGFNACVGILTNRPTSLKSLSIKGFWFDEGVSASEDGSPAVLWRFLADSLERLEIDWAEAEWDPSVASHHVLYRLKYFSHNIKYWNPPDRSFSSCLPSQLRCLDFYTPAEGYLDNWSPPLKDLERLRLRITVFIRNPGFTDDYLDALMGGLRDGVYPALKRLEVVLDVRHPIAEGSWKGKLAASTESRLKDLQYMGDDLRIEYRSGLEDRELDVDKHGRRVERGDRWFDEPLDTV